MSENLAQAIMSMASYSRPIPNLRNMVKCTRDFIFFFSYFYADDFTRACRMPSTWLFSDLKENYVTNDNIFGIYVYNF